MDTNVEWVVDSKILSCEGADREQEDVGQENAEETLVAETHPESPRKTLDAEDCPSSADVIGDRTRRRFTSAITSIPRLN